MRARIDQQRQEAALQGGRRSFAEGSGLPMRGPIDPQIEDGDGLTLLIDEVDVEVCAFSHANHIHHAIVELATGCLLGPDGPPVLVYVALPESFLGLHPRLDHLRGAIPSTDGIKIMGVGVHG